LIDAIAGIRVEGVKTSGPMAGKVIADDMADAILAQLDPVPLSSPDPVTVSREDLRVVLSHFSHIPDPLDGLPDVLERLATALEVTGERD
jgi:hypothetical protein